MLQLGEAQTQTKKNIIDVKQNNRSNKATIKKKKKFSLQCNQDWCQLCCLP